MSQLKHKLSVPQYNHHPSTKKELTHNMPPLYCFWSNLRHGTLADRISGMVATNVP